MYLSCFIKLYKVLRFADCLGLFTSSFSSGLVPRPPSKVTVYLQWYAHPEAGSFALCTKHHSTGSGQLGDKTANRRTAKTKMSLFAVAAVLLVFLSGISPLLCVRQSIMFCMFRSRCLLVSVPRRSGVRRGVWERDLGS